MLAITMCEQQFRALDMIDDANEANNAVTSSETAWSQADLHEILKLSFYAEDADAVLNAIAENMSEEQQQQPIIDTRPVKELAEKLLEQAQTNGENQFMKEINRFFMGLYFFKGGFTMAFTGTEEDRPEFLRTVEDMLSIPGLEVGSMEVQENSQLIARFLPLFRQYVYLAPVKRLEVRRAEVFFGNSTIFKNKVKVVGYVEN